MMSWMGCVACTAEKRNAYKCKPEGKRLFGKPRCRWENDKISPRLTGLLGVDWILLAVEKCK
jgi:hypothetical protein